MTQKSGKDAPLICEVIGDRLIISVGVDVLAFAALHSRYVEQIMWSDHKNDWIRERVKIADARAFAKDIRMQLIDEAEDGTTAVDLLFDKAVQDAIENACESVEIDEDAIAAEDVAPKERQG